MSKSFSTYWTIFKKVLNLISSDAYYEIVNVDEHYISFIFEILQ